MAGTRTELACLRSVAPDLADFAAVAIPTQNEEAAKLTAMLDHAIERAGDRFPHAVEQARTYRDALTNADQFTVAMLRHCTRDLCGWINERVEGRVA